jgi:hypothetical protein
MPPTMKFIRPLFAAAAVLALVGCGAATTTTSVSVSPSPASASPSASPVASPTPDLGAASAAALTLFVEDPSLAGHWGSCEGAGVACPLTAQVQARLDALRTQGYFGDAPPLGVCAEDYITGTQNGFNNAPQVLSAVAGANGSVTVVIQRVLGRPNLTAVMNEINGTWLASDLASGTGPSASIFSAKPNC